MFGFSFSELIVVVLVALVVMGPKDLPKMLRRVGQWAGKLRRAAADLRAQSGIDDALRSEGLADDINEIRKLARGELDAVRQVASISADELNGTGGSSSSSPSSSSSGNSGDNYSRGDDFYVVRDREYPRDGADSYNALPENAIVYSDGLPKSELHKDALYRMGDPNAEIPPDPPPPPGHEPVVGPTLMGIGAEELAKQEEEEKKKASETTEAAAAAETSIASEETSSTESDAPSKEDPSSSSSPSDVGPTLIGVGAVDATGKPHEGAR